MTQHDIVLISQQNQLVGLLNQLSTCSQRNLNVLNLLSTQSQFLRNLENAELEVVIT